MLEPDRPVRKKGPTEIDRHVGTRVRFRRVMLGMSQEKLGEALGITFQQIQKYEKGTNRISASSLQRIASILGVSIDYLYASQDSAAPGVRGMEEPARESPVDPELFTADGLKLLNAFKKIRNKQLRRRLVELVVSIANGDSSPEVLRSE